MVTNEVMRGEEVDVSEPYYYINGFNDNQPRIEVMDFSCVTLGSLGHFFTKKGSGITTIDGLVAAISAVGENSLTGRQVGFIGDGNWHSNSDLLPSNTVAQLDLQDQDQLEAAVSGTSPTLALTHHAALHCAPGVSFCWRRLLVWSLPPLWREPSGESACARPQALYSARPSPLSGIVRRV